MFFNYRHLENFGYEILGIGCISLHTCHNYIKRFPENNSLVIYSSIADKVITYKLTKEQYQDFADGNFALSYNGNGGGTTPCGYPVKNYGYHNVSSGQMKNRKELKRKLDIAEEIATL